MYGVYPGALYPGYYGGGVEVPVVRPPSLCLTSGVAVQYVALSDVHCSSLVTSKCVLVTYPAVPATEVTTLVVSCQIDVREPFQYETLEVRGFVTSSVKARYAEVVVVEYPEVASEVAVRYLGTSAIDCQNPGVTSEVAMKVKITSEVKFCCVGVRPCE